MPYLTYADKYFIGTYLYQLVAALKTVYAISSPAADHMTNCLLLGIWVLPHVALGSLDQFARSMPTRWAVPRWRRLMCEKVVEGHWNLAQQREAKRTPLPGLCDKVGNVTDDGGEILDFHAQRAAAGQ